MSSNLNHITDIHLTTNLHNTHQHILPYIPYLKHPKKYLQNIIQLFQFRYHQDYQVRYHQDYHFNIKFGKLEQILYKDFLRENNSNFRTYLNF